MNFEKIIFYVILMTLTVSLNAQVGKEGMTIKKDNYQTFTEKSVSNIKFWKEYNDKKFYRHPEFGVLPSNCPKGNIVEVLSKRTAKARYFVNLNNPTEFNIQKGYYPINYLDSNGFWRSIETELAPVGDNIYESKYYYEPAGFNLNQDKSFIKTQSGKIDFNQWSLYKKIGDKIEFLSKPNWSNYSVGEDGVYIKNIFDGIDAEMKVRKGSIETNFIMGSNEFGIFDELIFRDDYQANKPLSLSFSSGSDKNQGIGDVDIKENGKPALTMHEGVGYLMLSPRERTSLMYAINNQQVDVIVPFTWIDENIKENVLVIDPVVTGVATTAMIGIIGSMYNSSCNFDNSCNYDMSVVFPPYATVTNTTTDFDYLATGSCYFQDGATRFSSGTCLSPGQANYYWFCNSIGQGTCTGEDTPIYNDIASCLPAPSCTSQNIPFQLQFYRSCYGNPGCSNDCIAAISDWVVTLTGKTVSFDDSTNHISLSNSQICLGDTIIASTEGAYGVPLYTYNWSFSPSGNPSIGTSNTENIIFPNSGSHKLYVTITDNCNQIVNDSLVVVVGDTIVPSFAPIGPFCLDEQAILPTTSDNGISGTWSPTLNTSFVDTKTYTFTSSGCSHSVSRVITVLKSPFAGISEDEQSCEGDTTLPKITFTAGNTNPPYTFIYAINGDTMQITTTNNDNTATITIPTDTSGIFNVELIQVKDTICEKDINKSATVTIFNTPISDFNASSYSGEPGDEIFFQNNSTDEDTIEWFHYLNSLSFWGNQDNFSHIFTESGDHQIILVVKNDYCEDSIAKIIKILPKEATYILPNVFTPNGDGINDVLDFHFDNVKELKLVILNRWGNIVYQTNSPAESWNGKLNNSGTICTEGVYFYKFTIKGLSGDNNEENGFVHLVGH